MSSADPMQTQWISEKNRIPQHIPIHIRSIDHSEWDAGQTTPGDGRVVAIPKGYRSRQGSDGRVLAIPPGRRAIEQAGKNVWTKLAGKIYSKELLSDILMALEEYRQDI